MSSLNSRVHSAFISAAASVSDRDFRACLFPHVPLGDVAHDDADRLVLRKECLGDNPARISGSTQNGKHWRALLTFRGLFEVDFADVNRHNDRRRRRASVRLTWNDRVFGWHDDS